LQRPTFDDLIAFPSAKILSYGQTTFELRLLPEGTFLGALQIGVLNKVNFSLSYGAAQFLSYEKPDWNKKAGFMIKYLACPEAQYYPAVALGFDAQGWGDYFSNPATGHNRYRFKAPGAFVVTSKCVKLRCIGYTGFHLGTNLSLLEWDDDNDINFYLGFDKHIWKTISVAGEYNFALNDNASKAYNKRSGYFDLALRFETCYKIRLEIALIDLAGNNKNDADKVTKVFRFIYKVS
jgi:hypothetical protein